MRLLKKVFIIPNLLVVAAISMLFVSLWAYLNRPEQEPVWPKGKVQGFAFSPMRQDDNPLEQLFPTVDEVDADLALLKDKTHAIRTYSMEAVLPAIPRLAEKYDLNVALGAWIGLDPLRNEQEVQALIATASISQNVVRVMVGNEALLRGEISLPELAGFLDRVRAELEQPVSTAEPWHVWKKNPALAEHVDYLAVHMLPYWEGIDLDQSIDYIVEHVNELKELFPEKPIVIAEVGWPSNGRTRYSAVASPSHQAAFLRRFLQRAEQEQYVYYIMEAFDQPWKSDSEGAVGAYWGVYDASRQQKFPFTQPIVAIPEWSLLAGISIVIASITLLLLLIDSQTLRTRGRSFLALIAYAAATTAVWITYDYIHQYLTVWSIGVGILLLVGMLSIIVIVLAEAHEWAEVLWVKEWRRPFRPMLAPDHELPFVSIHVPIHNEPAQMVIATLNALAALSYPRYEVIVVDNNTQDESVWQPVAEHCARLGPKFRFFHVNPLTGFKAGALNFALRQTHLKAEIVGVLDADYVVHHDWLKELVPQFREARLAIVQAPQDYRDDRINSFKSMCYSEYCGFFFIGMVTRNERNAIIQHGTMTLIRKEHLTEVGGWAEWCITEDAELGLRIFEHGYQALYVNKSYGQGLMPDTFADFKKQRFRWTYGAMQIIRHHAKFLLGRAKSHLSYGQRYHFLVGWLPWLADAGNLFFNIAALLWSVAMIVAPQQVDPPLAEFSLLPLTLFSFKLGKLIYLYRARIHASFLHAIAAAIAGLSLSYTIAHAVLQGLITKQEPFFRTPKLAHHPPALIRTLASAWQEVLMIIAFVAAAWGLMRAQNMVMLDMRLWLIVLAVQALPYLASFIMALLSSFSRLPAWLFGPSLSLQIDRKSSNDKGHESLGLVSAHAADPTADPVGQGAHTR